MRWIAPEDPFHLAVVGLIQALRAGRTPRATGLAAKFVGAAACRLSRTKRRGIADGVSHWRGQSLGPRENRFFVHAVFFEAWREILFSAEVERATRVASNFDVVGLEHLRAALDRRRGAILWESSGFGHRLYSKAALRSRGYEILQVHGVNHLGGLLVTGSSLLRSRIVRPFFDRRELTAVGRIIRLRADAALGHLRPLVESLRENTVICLSADGGGGRRFIERRFLNHLIPFPTGGVSLARLSGAPLIPLFCYKPDEGRPIVALESPIEIASDASRDHASADAVQQFIDLLTGYVERYPTQYRNWHLLGPALPRA
jgi:lauroyl/myristoyl acyltransferase